MENVRPTERHLLHFDASYFGDEPLTVHVAQRDFPIARHTPDTLLQARGTNPILRFFPDSELSHFAEVQMPSDAIAMVQTKRKITLDGFEIEVIAGLKIHIPREGFRSERRQAMQKYANASAELHPKLAMRQGMNADAETLALLNEQPDLLHDVFNPFETAAALIYQHPSLINLSTDGGGTVPAIILRRCISEALKQKRVLVDQIEELGPRWCSYMKLMDDGKPVYDSDGKTPIYTMVLNERVKDAMPQTMALALKYSQQPAELERQTWTVQYGKTTNEDKKAMSAAQESRELLRANQTKWKKKALSSEFGVNFDEKIEFDEPRPGGWTIEGIWSTDDPKTPMPEAFIKGLIAGTAFLRVDTEQRPNGAWTIRLPKKADVAEEFLDHQITFGDQTDPMKPTGGLATLRLNPLRTDLSVVTALSPFAGETLKQINLGFTHDGKDDILWTRAGTTQRFGELRLRARNEKLRHLSAYVEFFDAKDQPIKLAPITFLPLGVAELFDSHATKRYLDVISPVDTVFGIPLEAEWLTVKIPFPQEAVKARLYWGGLGTGKYDQTVCAVGITLTVVLELALPVFLLALGAAEAHTGFISKMLGDKALLYSLIAIGATLVGAGAHVGLSQDPGRAASTVGLKLGPALAKFGLGRLSVYLARKGGEGAAKRAVPLVNLAFLAFDTAVTALQLGQTIVAIVQSPFYYDIEVTRSFDLAVTLTKDAEIGRFPDEHDLLRVQVIYDTGAELKYTDQTLSKGPIASDIKVRFNECPAGGRIKVLAFFYSASGWQSGSGSSGWIDAKGENDTSERKVSIAIKNALIPLSKESVYQHRRSITFVGGLHRWKVTGTAPTDTKSTPPPDADHQLLTLNAITVAQRPSMVGYAWQARGLNLPRDKAGTPTNDALFAVQNLSVLEDPSSRYAISPVGFSAQSGITYDLTCADDGSGLSFFIDPTRGDFDATRNPAGGYHLRRVALSSGAKPQFTPGSGGSWGRFPRPLISFVLHPQGYVAGITAEADKIYLLKLPTAPTDDKDATMASLASGEGTRDGLLKDPRAICVALDGRLLVLEHGNRRIQSFDFTGNPVPYFKPASGSTKSPVMALRTTPKETTYLDLSVEAKGYIFVLAYEDTGAQASQYGVDIYEPDGTFLVSTPGVAAAKIAVDLARAMYTLNWETLRGPDGRAEPSVSVWTPPAPPGAGEPS